MFPSNSINLEYHTSKLIIDWGGKRSPFVLLSLKPVGSHCAPKPRMYPTYTAERLLPIGSKPSYRISSSSRTLRKNKLSACFDKRHLTETLSKGCLQHLFQRKSPLSKADEIWSKCSGVCCSTFASSAVPSDDLETITVGTRTQNSFIVCLIFLGESAFEFWADNVQDRYCHLLLLVICDWLCWGVIPVPLSTAHTWTFFGRLYQLRKIQYFLVHAQKPHIDLTANFTVEAYDIFDLLKTKVYVF